MDTPLLRGYRIQQNERSESSIPILPDQKQSGDCHGKEEQDPLTTRKETGVDMRFLLRLGKLMVLARAQGALLLGALSIVEVLVIAQVGVVPGLFYKALLDHDAQLFKSSMWRALLWYGSAAICAGVKLGVSEMLALQWRKRLTLAAHSRYCRSSNVFRLMKDGTVDNPDQRVAQEIQLFSTGLAQLLYKTVVAPLMIAYYTVLVWMYVGWTGPFAVYLFFSVGTLGARCLISPIAALVAKQEKLEGDFRVAHVRLRNNAEQVALYASSPVEHTALNHDLNCVLTNQRALVIRHTILELGSKVYDYTGSILNYAILALPIFAGIYGKGGEVDKGKVAQLVSNASFAVLTLIYSFTQLIDAAKVLSDVAGVTGRVAGLFEALEKVGGTDEHLVIAPEEKQPRPKQGPQSLAQFLAQSVAFTPSLPGLKDRSSPTSLVNPYPWSQSLPNLVAPVQTGLPNGLLLGPMTSCVAGGSLELTVHQLPAELRGSVQEVFSEQGFPGLWTQPLLVVPTFQCARVELWEATSSGSNSPGVQNQPSVNGSHVGGFACQGSSAEEATSATNQRGVFLEMVRLADVFATWQDVICRFLREQGFWAAAVDPRTGFALPLVEPLSAAEPLDCGVEAIDDFYTGGQSSCRGEKEVDTRAVGISAADESTAEWHGWEHDSLQERSPLLLTSSAKGPNSSYGSNPAQLDSSLTLPCSTPEIQADTRASIAPAPEVSVSQSMAVWACEQSPAAYSEIHGAEVLLGYEIGTAGNCPVVFHPRFGARTYPASLFTNAPLEVLSKALEKAEAQVSNQIAPAKAATNGVVSAVRDDVSIMVSDGFAYSNSTLLPDSKQGSCQDLRHGVSGPVLEVSELTVRTPGGGLVVRGLDLIIRVGERLMLMGPSGCGKTTLVRTISGLWPQESGSIQTAPQTGARGVLFLPQTPLLARGGLAAQVAYPLEVPVFTQGVESRMQEALTTVDLNGLLQRVDGDWTREEEWPVILSPGEQQRLSLARVLFHRPQLAVLDEATSAIGEELEARIYSALASLPISCLTISHRHTLTRWHSKLVDMLGDTEGTWSLQEVT